MIEHLNKKNIFCIFHICFEFYICRICTDLNLSIILKIVFKILYPTFKKLNIHLKQFKIFLNKYFKILNVC